MQGIRRGTKDVILEIRIDVPVVFKGGDPDFAKFPKPTEMR